MELRPPKKTMYENISQPKILSLWNIGY